MKKMLKTMVVAGLAGVMTLAFAGTAGATVSLSPAVTSYGNNPDTPGSVTVFCIQTEGGSTYLVIMPTSAAVLRQQDAEASAQVLSSPAMGNIIELAQNHAAEHTSIVNMLPEPETILALGLAGFMMRRSRKRRAVFIDSPVQI